MDVVTLETLRPPAAPMDLGDEKVDVTIVMPCLNEELSLPFCLAQAKETVGLLADKGYHAEVVVADNGSTDRSLEIIESYGARVVHCPLRGYGNALRWGISSSRGRYVIMGDADGSYDFREAVAMIERLAEGYDVCMGSRFKGKIMPGAMPWKNRYIGNPLLTGLLNVFFRSGLSDAHCGLRAFSRDAFARINPTSPGMEFASEMVVKGALLRLKSTEVPVTLWPDKRDRPPHLRPFQDGWRHLRFLFMLSPLWLYFVPAITLSLMGLGVMVLLLLTPAGEVAHLGRFWIGEHWAAIATLALVTGHQAAMLGLVATLAGVRERYRHVSPMLRWVFQVARLDRLLMLGAATCLMGAVVVGSVVWAWAASGFGPMQKTREMMAGTTLLILGVQTILSAFLLSVVGGNDAELAVVERRYRASAKPTSLL